MARRILLGVVVLALLGGLAAVLGRGGSFTATAVLPNAGNLFVGSSVMYDGYEAGSVKSIDVKDGRAVVELSIDDEFGPLHDGATAEVIWKAALGERLVRVVDGPEENAELPDDAMLRGIQREPVELDAVLSALDGPTRQHLASLVTRLRGTLAGREVDANASLRTAGPALRELGAVLREVGADGEAIKQVVTQFDETMGILATRDESLEQIVTSLASATRTVAEQEEGLGATLEKLPPVLQRATGTLARVPRTVDVTLPLLEELAPATANLRSVSRNLEPLLRDLRPTVAQLQPTLDSLSQLLGITPGLLDAGTATVPDVDDAMAGLTPALDFLRPYTPEIAGWATSWGSAGANYDANGKYVRFHIQTGPEALIPSSKPGLGVTQDLTPAPGAPVDQPWTDAYGSEMR
jgi:phospholipid/cholesterol/gamma-HCH transport system substrate-binding protein